MRYTAYKIAYRIPAAKCCELKRLALNQLALKWLARKCPALKCPALKRLALKRPARKCPALKCPALKCPTSPRARSSISLVGAQGEFERRCRLAVTASFPIS
ncbi:hypothetical protein L596_019793 [Steinernema carpocapsae]|uniref:Uncharacterized protein n=1 Tax=Steinernema carpocapsae TaxID=34508 RepID=A0A4U5MRQ6_STECR|nr:hypothetical protein L596_019793 [Steinernema carpocapsae]